MAAAYPRSDPPLDGAGTGTTYYGTRFARAEAAIAEPPARIRAILRAR